MTVDVDQETQALIAEQLRSGEYSDANELLKAALRLLQKGRGAFEDDLLESLRALEEGIADAKAGRVYSIDEVFGELGHQSDEE